LYLIEGQCPDEIQSSLSLKRHGSEKFAPFWAYL
jgi:hypothetical protein